MKKYIFLLLLLSIPFLSCKKSSTEPEPDPEPEAIAEATIGSEGGVLQTEEFTLTIPNGAFSSSTTLKLYEENTMSLSNSISQMYKITGLPGNTLLPLQLQLKCSGSMTSSCCIAIGYEEYVMMLDSTIIVYDLVDATVSGEILTCEFEVQITNGDKHALESDNELWIIGLSGGIEETESHFRYVEYSYHLTQAQKDDLKYFLEQLYTKYENLNFDYSRKIWPVRVDIYNTNEGFLGIPRKSGERAYLSFRIPEGTNINDQKYSIELTFAYMVLNLYKSFPNNRYNWFDIAYLNWVSLEYDYWTNTNFRNYVSDVFGGFGNIGDSERFHGQAMGLALEFLLPRFGENSASQILKKISEGKEIIRAIIETTEDPWEWLDEFHKNLISDELYSNLLGDYWVTNSEEIIQINNSNKEKQISDSYYDLSGKWYKIELGNDITENSNLTLESYFTDGLNADLTLYRFKNNNLFWLAESNNAGIILENVTSIINDGEGIIALVSNGKAISPYTNQYNITLDIKLSGGTEEETYKKAKIWIHGLNGHFKTEFNNGNDPNEYDAGFGTSSNTDAVTGTFEGNTFTANFDYDNSLNSDYRHTGTILIELNDSLNTILRCELEETKTKYSDENYSLHIEVSVKNVEIYNDNTLSTQFYLVGSTVCNKVTDFEYTLQEGSGTSKKVTTLLSYGCDDNSGLQITLYKPLPK